MHPVLFWDPRKSDQILGLRRSVAQTTAMRWRAVHTQQVMPAMKKTKPVGEVSAGMAAQHGEVIAEACEIMAAQGDNSEQLAKSARSKRKAEHLASLHTIRALDHQLRLAGVGFNLFARVSHYSRLLRQDEVRYMATVPGGDSMQPTQRLVVKHLCTGAKRFETPPIPPEGLPVLVLHHDECSSNLCALQFLSGHMHLRAISWRDPLHRIWNDFRQSVKDVGAWGGILECFHIMGLSHGPWQSGAWWRTTKAAVDEFFGSENYSDPLWVCLGEEIAKDYSAQCSSHTSSEDPAVLWNLTTACPAFASTGNRPTLTRWFEIVDRWQKYDEDYNANFMAILLARKDMKVYDGVLDMPVWGLPLDLPKLEKATVKKPPGMKNTMKQATAEEQLAEQRLKARNALHLGAVLLGQPGGRRRKRVIMVVGSVLHGAYQKELRAFSDPEALAKFTIAPAKFGGSYYLRKIFMLLSDAATLRRLGFQLDSSSSDRDHYLSFCSRSASSSSSAEQEKILEPLRVHQKDTDDVECATFLWQLCLSAVKNRGLSMCQHTSTLPGVLTLLAPKRDRPTVRPGLGELRLFWETLISAEAAQFKFPAVGEILRDIGWVHNDAIRECLALLAEADFKRIPEQVDLVVQTLVRGFGGSVLNERCFRSLTDCKRQNSNSKVSRLMRYYHPSLGAKLLPEHGMDEVSFEGAGAMCGVPRRFPDKMFEATGMDCSLDPSVLTDIQNRRAWRHPSTSAAGLQVEVSVWQLLMYANVADCWDKLGTSWQALLLPDGAVVKQKSTNSFFINLRSSPCGSLMWPAQRAVEGRLCLYRPIVDEGTQCTWRPVLCSHDFEIIPVSALPGHLKLILTGGDGGSFFGISLMQTGPAEAPSVASARFGFKSLTSGFIDKLIASIGIFEAMPKKDRPRSVLAKCEALIKHFLPNITAAEIVAALKERNEQPQARESPLMHGNNLEHCDGTMDQGDSKDAKEFQEQVRKPRVSAQKATIDFCASKGYMSLEQVMQEEIRLGLRSKPTPLVAGKSAPMKDVWTWQESELKRLCSAVGGQQFRTSATNTPIVGRDFIRAVRRRAALALMGRLVCPATLRPRSHSVGSGSGTGRPPESPSRRIYLRT